MRLLALIEAPDHVCYRYRVAAFVPALADAGWTVEAQPLQRGWWSRQRQLRQAARADAVLLQRKLLPLWQLCVLRRAARRLIYDFDDAVFLRDSFSPKGQASRMRLLRFWAHLFAADAVLAGNGHLRDCAAALVDADKVRLLPTVVEPDRYPVAAHRRVGGQAVLVWIGQRSTLPSLNAAAEHLRAAATAVKNIPLRVIADRFPALPGIRVLPRLWSQQTEAADLASADIGISWLPSDAWSLGKCGLKVLQYMAAGLPVVANPVGIHRTLVHHGATGFLAETPGQWAQAVARLAGDPALRTRLGGNARRWVEQRFSVDRWAGAFAGAITAPHCGAWDQPPARVAPSPPASIVAALAGGPRP